MRTVLCIAPNEIIFMQALEKRIVAAKDYKFNHTTKSVICDDVRYILILRPEQMRGHHGVEVEWMAVHLLSNINEFSEQAMLARMK